MDSLEDVERLTVAAYESMLGDDLTFDDILRRRIIMPNRLGGVAMGRYYKYFDDRGDMLLLAHSPEPPRTHKGGSKHMGLCLVTPQPQQ